jgi:putative ATPase
MSLEKAQKNVPLADRVRPKSLKEFIGQDHVVGEGQFLRTIIEKKQPTSLIFWGPPGVGKTTLARIIADNSDMHFVELSAVTSGIPRVREVIAEAKAHKRLGEDTLLFVDEIHRFNKAQQDAFLPHVEDGTIILVGATTENPSFEVISPLLSRMKVVVLKELSEEDIVKVIKQGVKQLPNVNITKKATEVLAKMAAGDARVALNGLEVAARLAGGKSITPEIIEQAMQQTALMYDKNGEDHYNTISAFIKSMRGSDADASLYYLHRMIASGEDPKFIARRMVIFASEDIGMAAPYALTLAVSAFEAVERIGLPEAQYALSQAAIALATSPKSRAVSDAMYAAKGAVKENPSVKVPMHLRNAVTDLMKDQGYGEGYKMYDDKSYLPKGLENEKFYNPPKAK